MNWAIVVLISVISLACATPLDDYVNRPDPTYAWNVAGSFTGVGYTAYSINLTSQTWLTAADTDRPVWQHWLVVCVPNTVGPYNVGAIYIDGGHNSENSSPPTKLDPAVNILCVSSQTVVAHLQQIPNQPITFTADPKKQRRSEDAVIAFTWAHFLNDTSKPDWLLRLPMTKAVVRAMDTIQNFTSTMPQVPPIKEFLIAGASKRGWTTWTTAVVDKRVGAIAPMVIPVLNMQPTLNVMYQAYGKWSFALKDYLAEGVMAFLNRPEFYEMAAIVDPFSYLDRLTMPKYIICAAGDEFFLPDSTRFFFDQLKGGPNLLRVVPDAEHSLVGQQIDIALSIETFYKTWMTKTAMPTWNWKLIRSNSTGAQIVANIVGQKPEGVYLWKATTLPWMQRDFRLITCTTGVECINPVIWTYTTLTPTVDGVYSATIDAPEVGYTGFLIEAVFGFNYPGDPLNPTKRLRLTTEVNVVPESFPFPPCGNNCQPPSFEKPHEI